MEKFNADLHLLHVEEELAASLPDAVVERFSRLEKYQEDLELPALESLSNVLDPEWAAGRHVTIATRSGQPFVQIMAYAKEYEIDVIVTGTHGRSGLSHALIGSLAERVVRQAPCPVLTVRPEGNTTIRIQRILFPTDFSTNSATATKYACELATRFDAELHLLHTLEVHPAATPEFAMGLALPSRIAESRAAAEESLAGVLDPQWSAGRKVVDAILEGSPKVEIVRYARKQNIDLIVLSTHGRSGLDHVIMGSVAENVVRTAPCPVLTVRPKGHQFVMP